MYRPNWRSLHIDINGLWRLRDSVRSVTLNPPSPWSCFFTGLARPCVCVLARNNENDKDVNHIDVTADIVRHAASGTLHVHIACTSSHVKKRACTKHGSHCHRPICQSSRWFAVAIDGWWNHFTVHRGRIYECLDWGRTLFWTLQI